MSEKLGIKEYSPFKTSKIDVSNKPDLVKTAVKAQEKRKDLAESEEQWRKYRKEKGVGEMYLMRLEKDMLNM